MSMIPPRMILLLLAPFVLAFLLQPESSNCSFLPSTWAADVQSKSIRNILLVTAHPDDEALFFAPTLLGLRKAAILNENAEAAAGGAERGGQAVIPTAHVLCLSTGNSSGLGGVRTQELRDAAVALGVLPDNLDIIDSPKLQDDITSRWPNEVIADTVQAYVRTWKIDVLLTFDAQGISSHPNHASLPSGLVHMLRSPPFTSTNHSDPPLPRPALYTLSTVPLPIKYTSFLAALLANADLRAGRAIRWVAALYTGRKDVPGDAGAMPVYISSPWEYWRAVRAAGIHWSQMVWFRWGWLLASRYMWVNEWTEVRV